MIRALGTGAILVFCYILFICVDLALTALILWFFLRLIGVI